MTNSTGCGCEKIHIQCKAHDCVYNAGEKCEAAQVNIAGAGACVCQETKCGTFERMEPPVGKRLEVFCRIFSEKKT